MRLVKGVPVLARGTSDIQVGLRNAIVFRDVNAADRSFLERLESPGGVALREAKGREHLVRVLDESPLLHRARGDGHRHPTVTISHPGWVGLAMGMALAESGLDLGFMNHAATGQGRSMYDNGAGEPTGAGAAAFTVARRVPHATARVVEGPGDITVLVSAGAPDLPGAARLMAQDRIHIAVVTDHAGVQVGPLVIPGRSACLNCEGLHRTEADEAWPSLALQVGSNPERQPWAPPDAVASAAGALAALVTALGNESSQGEGWINGVLQCDSGARPAWRRLTPRADCGCGAAGDVGDEIAAKRATWN